ncbi:MAG: lipoate--protein ligase family protein [Verrucomicrobiota bacterium]
MHVLPTRTLSAGANMAVDQLLLEAYPQPGTPRFRHYQWSNPSFTFGRTQRWAEAEEHIPVHASWREAHDHFAGRFELVRRCTGGGVVDHRDDWTYSLVIPADHPLAKAKASEAYQEVHHLLIWALKAQSVDSKLAPCPCDTDEATEAPTTAASCFQRAEPGDVIDLDGEKLAGAAQRRSKDGLLMQGSIARAPIRAINWDQFEQSFTAALAEWLGGSPAPAPFPKWSPAQLSSQISHYESKEWNERR